MATLRGTVDEGEACGLGTNVSLHEATFGAGGLELGRRGLAALAVPIAESHARVLGSERDDPKRFATFRLISSVMDLDRRSVPWSRGHA